MTSERRRRERSEARIARAEAQKAARSQKWRDDEAEAAAKRRADASCNRKLDRAEMFVAELAQESRRWLGTRAFQIVDEPQSEPNRFHTVARIGQAVPAAIPVALGDAVHNLRAALDHLAFALAVAHQQPNRLSAAIKGASEFPIFDLRNQAKFSQTGRNGRPVRGSGLYKLQGVHPDAVRAIEAMQPYHDGADYTQHPLWIIHELDRIDKHRRLNVVAYTADNLDFAITGSTEYFYLEEAITGGIAHDGMVLARYAARNARYRLRYDRRLCVDEPLAGAFLPEQIVAIRDYVRDEVIAKLSLFL